MEEKEELSLDMLEPDDIDDIEGNLTGEEKTDVDGDVGDVQNVGTSTEDLQAKDTEGQQDTDAKKPYTPEEVTELLNSGEKLDTDRLTPEGKLLEKSFQRGLTRKFEELAEKTRLLETEKQRVSDPKEQVYQQYIADPMGVTARINTEIEKFADVPPSSEHFAEAQKAIIRLQSFKEDLSMRRQQATEMGRNLEVLVKSSNMELQRDIPDFNQKRDKLTNYAMELGLDIDEIQFLTDPVKVRGLATKITKIINGLYDKSQAAKTAEQKLVRKTPERLAGGGSTSDGNVSTLDPNKMTATQYRAWREGKSKTT